MHERDFVDLPWSKRIRRENQEKDAKRYKVDTPRVPIKHSVNIKDFLKKLNLASRKAKKKR